MRAAGLTRALLLGLPLALGACAPFPALRVDTPQGSAAPTRPASRAARARAAAQPSAAAAFLAAQPAAPPANAPATPEQIAALFPAAPFEAELPPQPLPQLINTLFGELLRVPFSMGPEVSARRDVVALRGVRGMTRRDFVRLVQTALRDYGVRLSIRDGAVILAGDEAAGKAAPVFLRARSTPETPEPARPVVEFYAANAIEAQSLLALLTDVFPAGRRIAARADPASNSLTLEGDASDVAAALELVRQLDQPAFAGAQALRFEPVFWSSETFAAALRDALTAQGYAVAGVPSRERGIGVLAFPGAGQVVAFARTDAQIAAVRQRAEALDQPAAVTAGAGTFVYRVRNTDAQSLGDLVNQSTSTLPAGALQPQQAAVTGVAGTPPAGLPAGPPPATTSAAAPPLRLTGGVSQSGAMNFGSGRMIVDVRGNRILFTGPAAEFAQLRGLLASLDAPPRQVLVEVTIAEVTLTDETRAGLEFFFSRSLGNGTLSGGTQGGLGLGSSGLSLRFTGGNLTAAFNAFASNNKVNILSRPRLVTRSGGEASIQVGTDVPIITSQASTPTTTSGPPNVLQTIQYRQTGVILRIRPVVFGDELVNLDITQEVSSQQANPNAAIGSPLILNRNVTTQITIANGSTAVLGGLIDDNYTKGNSGIPFLKDVPLVGNAFRTDTVSGQKTELVMLVTPYVLTQPEQIGRWSGAYAAGLNAAYRVGQGGSYTLTPFGGRAMGLPTVPRP